MLKFFELNKEYGGIGYDNKLTILKIKPLTKCQADNKRYGVFEYWVGDKKGKKPVLLELKFKDNIEYIKYKNTIVNALRIIE